MLKSGRGLQTLELPRWSKSPQPTYFVLTAYFFTLPQTMAGSICVGSFMAVADLIISLLETNQAIDGICSGA